MIRASIRDAAGAERFKKIRGSHSDITLLLKKLDSRERTVVQGSLARNEPRFADDPEGLKVIGDAYFHMDNFERCAAMGERYQALRPMDPFGYKLQALAFQKLRKFKEAETLSAKAVLAGEGKNPDDIALFKRSSRKRRKSGPKASRAAPPEPKREFRFHESFNPTDREIIEEVLRAIMESARGRSIVAQLMGNAGQLPTAAKLWSQGVEFKKAPKYSDEVTRIDLENGGKVFRITLSPDFFKTDREEQAAYLAGELANVKLVQAIPKGSNTLETLNRIGNRAKVAIDFGMKPAVDAFSPRASIDLAFEIKIWNGDFAELPSISPQQREFLKEKRGNGTESLGKGSKSFRILEYALFLISKVNHQKVDEIAGDPTKERLHRAIMAQLDG